MAFFDFERVSGDIHTYVGNFALQIQVLVLF